MRIVSILICILLIPCYTFGKTYRVDISEISPNVIVDKNITGFDIEIWEAVANKMDIDFEYNITTFGDILNNIKKGISDVGISAITINSSREKDMDFSYPYLNSGLRIVIPKSQFEIVWLTTKTIFKYLLYLFIFVIIFAHILYFVELGEDNGITNDYFPGIFEAAWCIMATVTTVGYGDKVAKLWRGRICLCLTMLVGITFFTYIAAQLNSSITVYKMINNQINLKTVENKIVITKAKTTSEMFLNSHNIKCNTVETIEEMFEQMKKNPIMFDSPCIMYNIKNNISDYNVSDIIDPQYYGFALKNNSELKEKINIGLLELKESGEYDRIYKKWFN